MQPSSRTRRRDYDPDEQPFKANNFEGRHDQVQMVALNVFLQNAGSRAMLIAGRCCRWLPANECQTLSTLMRARLLEIMGMYQQEIPKTEVVRFYTDFMANPLTTVRDRLHTANQIGLAQECEQLINQVNNMDEGAVQELINTFLDRAEQVLVQNT